MGETRTIAIEVPGAVAEELAEIARATEQPTADLARQAIDQFLDYEAWKQQAITEALAEVDAGGPLMRTKTWWSILKSSRAVRIRRSHRPPCARSGEARLGRLIDGRYPQH